MASYESTRVFDINTEAQGQSIPITVAPRADELLKSMGPANIVAIAGPARQGKSFFKARENGLHILFYPNGSFELARGAWEQFFDLKEGNFEKLRRAEAN